MSKLLEKIHLPIKMESVIPHETAGILAPLYKALGPCQSYYDEQVLHVLCGNNTPLC